MDTNSGYSICRNTSKKLIEIVAERTEQISKTPFIYNLKSARNLSIARCKSLQISRFAKLASFTVAGAMPQSANLLIFCALHSHNDTSLRNLGINKQISKIPELHHLEISVFSIT